VLGDPPYNLIVHTPPAGREVDYHWHIHIRPRLQQDAGFELGTGVLVNTVDPAEAAQRLR
jgi:UDPglucose--hexose-1-phosphate uridylyltransferase